MPAPISYAAASVAGVGTHSIFSLSKYRVTRIYFQIFYNSLFQTRKREGGRDTEMSGLHHAYSIRLRKLMQGGLTPNAAWQKNCRDACTIIICMGPRYPQEERIPLVVI